MIAKILAVIGILACSFVGIARAEYTDIFKENEGKVLDWAIASSKEATYYRDFNHGRNGMGGQVSIFFLEKYISGDVGYMSIYEDKQRGSITVGGSLRFNKILTDVFYGKVETLKDALPEDKTLLDRLFFGPWYSYHVTNDEHMYGIKAGFVIW